MKMVKNIAIVACAASFMFAGVSFHMANVYDELGTELPYYTVLMVDIGEWFQANLIFVTLTSFISMGSVWFATLTDRGRLIKDRLLFLI